MKPKNVIMWALLSAIVILIMSTGVQAQELTEVPANDILEQIQSGEDVHHDHVHVTGVLDLSKKIVESKITIKDSVFENNADFSNTQFRKTLDLSGTAFSDKTNFRSARFNDSAYFWNTNFSDNADFDHATFDGNAYFWFASFGEHADFGGVNFSGDTHFGSATFNGDTHFSSANFSGDTHFSSATFNGDAYFWFVNFSGDVNFVSACFNGKASFVSASFNDSANLCRCDFKSMEVSWSSLKDALVFDGPTYVKLIKNFREMEQFGDADDAYYQYRQVSQANKYLSFSKLGDGFMWVTCGYGVKPHYTLRLGVVLILIFALVYWLGDGIRRLKETDGCGIRVSFGDAFYFSMVTFTTVGYGDWYPTDKYRKFVMIEGLVGWLTLALFLVTLANVMIRP